MTELAFGPTTTDLVGRRVRLTRPASTLRAALDVTGTVHAVAPFSRAGSGRWQMLILCEYGQLLTLHDDALVSVEVLP